MRLCITTLLLLLALAVPARAALPQLDSVDGTTVWMLHDYESGGIRHALLVHAGPQGHWGRIWGGVVDVYPKDIVAISSDAVFVGDYGSRSYEDFVAMPGLVVRISPSGNVAWEREVTWSDHSIHLEAVTADSAGNIYATGQAWKYDDAVQPGGWHAVRGFVFTFKLSGSGEMLWARRWSADPYDFDSGLSIATHGGRLAVLAQYGGPLSGNYFAPLLLWYSTSDGSLQDSRIWNVPGRDVYPRSLDFDDSGLLCAACDMPEYSGGSEQQRDIVLLWFNGPGAYLLGTGVSGGGGSFLTAWDVSAAGQDFLISGAAASWPVPPDPDWSEHHVSNPLLLYYRGHYPVEDILLVEYSAKYQDAQLSTVAATASETVWVAGILQDAPESEVEVLPYGSAVYYPSGQLQAVTAWEAENCGSSSLAMGPSTMPNLASGSLLEYANNQRLYIGQVEWSYLVHQPDAMLEASATSGPAPLTVSFDASGSTIEEGSIVSYAFEVFIGESGASIPGSSGPSPTYVHTFNEPGTYRVRVLISGDEGGEGSAWLVINVS
ncbi:MAG: PKD domain-containing protein [Planctomycetales bacterium]|nr:PKD domain-containing protein [bacterium]UNM08951.1 MAG: PKD domain-containing protein [Planctomycetales bacterium]